MRPRRRPGRCQEPSTRLWTLRLHDERLTEFKATYNRQRIDYPRVRARREVIYGVNYPAYGVVARDVGRMYAEADVDEIRDMVEVAVDRQIEE